MIRGNTFDIFAVALCALCVMPALAGDAVFAISPDGRNEIRLSARPLAYEVLRDGVTVVAKSGIGMTIDGRRMDGADTTEPAVTTGKRSGVADAPVYKKSKVDLSANETFADFGKWGVRLVARNDGVAYRFETKMSGKIKVEGEKADLRVSAADAKCWGMQTTAFGCEESVPFSGKWNEIDFSRGMLYLPFAYEAGGKYVLVAESDVRGYPIWNFGSRADDTLHTKFAGAPKRTRKSGAGIRVLEHEGFLAETEGTRTFPWRVFVLADALVKFCEADILWALAPAQEKGADFSWVRPGKVAWDWWCRFDNGRKCDTKGYERFIDFAAAHGLEYVVLDWYGYEARFGFDIWKPCPAVDVDHLVKYAEERGVGLWHWLAFHQVYGDEERVAARFAKQGIKGFKVDFLDRGDADVTAFEEKFAAVCAKYRMQVEYHGEHRPTGLQRRYPNVLNYEGIHGQEWMLPGLYRGDERGTMFSDVAACYLRMSAGPMDYTPGAMLNHGIGSGYRSKDHPKAPGTVGTRCRQMAQVVLYEAPLQMLCDSPTNYEKNRECFSFMAKVPTVWKNVIGLAGTPDTMFVAARETRDGAWYAGGITTLEARDVALDTSFLCGGQKAGRPTDEEWTAEIFRDAGDAVEDAQKYIHETRRIKAGEKLSFHMAPGGGFVVMFSKRAEGLSRGRRQSDGVFISPRHSQVEMKGDWYPELQRAGKETRCHWMSGKTGESVTLRFEGTSVAISTRTGARVTWQNVTHTNSLARLGRFAVWLDGRPLAPISLAGSKSDAIAHPERSQGKVIPVAKGLPDGPHVLELINDGGGEVTLAGFVLDRPQKGAEPDYSRESPELAAETRKLPPILFVEGAPVRTFSGPSKIGFSSWPNDYVWGAAIKVLDPAHPEQPPRVLFSEDDSYILDLALSYDAKTIWFSMRRHKSPCWHIYRLNADGTGLVSLTSGLSHNTSPAPLPDGRLAFISSREPLTHLVCAEGPSTRVHVMEADGSSVKMISSNTLADFCVTVRRDGRLLYSRWEYVDWNIMSRQSLWTQYPDGRHLELFFGNLLDDPPTLIQARELPDDPASVVCTFAPHHGSPYGAIGVVSAENGPEGRRGAEVRWLTPELPSIMDFNHLWSYCCPYPLGGGRYLCSYGGGGMHRYRLSLIDEKGNRATVYDPKTTSAFCATPFVARPAPKTLASFSPTEVKSVKIPAAPPGQPFVEEVKVGCLYVTDVTRGYAEGVSRADVKAVRIMEQMPKTVDLGGLRAYDQSPVMGVGTYYAKRVWGYAPVEEDGSAYFEVPAMKEIYLQLVDGDGRELLRMTSALNVMPGESRSCAGCHESRMTASGSFTGQASRRPPTPLAPPDGLRAGVIDYMRDVQPIWNGHCVRCHGGTDPAGGLSLEDGRTRFFCRSYDGLNERAQSDRTSYLSYGGAPGAGKRKPLIHSILLNYGFADVLQPRQTGSYASRLPKYLERAHCGSDVTPAERRRVYEWIDAMVPYYSTTDCAHLNARGKRDRWGEPDSEKLAPWAVKYARTFARSCASCHGAFTPDRVSKYGDRRWEWVDLTRPDASPALVAHLPKSAGGRGLPANGKFAFSGRDDPRWKELRDLFRAGAAFAAQTPEPDEAGFVPRSRGRLEYETRLKRMNVNIQRD